LFFLISNVIWFAEDKYQRLMGLWFDLQRSLQVFLTFPGHLSLDLYHVVCYKAKVKQISPLILLFSNIFLNDNSRIYFHQNQAVISIQTMKSLILIIQIDHNE
jgi:hypothetical protein